jgi:hypothetical protein
MQQFLELSRQKMGLADQVAGDAGPGRGVSQAAPFLLELLLAENRDRRKKSPKHQNLGTLSLDFSP